jgi:hypothetical protein
MARIANLGRVECAGALHDFMVSKLFVMPSDTSTNWRSWNDSDDQWDAIVLALPNFTVYQSSRWASHKTSSGWSISRFVHIDRSNTPTTAAQCLVRRTPFNTAVVWIPGGPIGDLQTVNRELALIIKKTLGVSFIYIRCSVMEGSTPEGTKQLSSHGWRHCQKVIGARASLIHKLDTDQETRLTRCSSDFRRNLKRSAKIPSPPYAWRNPNPEEISVAYSLMDEFKRVEGLSLARSVEELQSLITAFGDDLLLYRSDNADGSPLAIRGALRFGDVVWDFIALTTPAGRKTSASYAVFWMLAEKSYQLGITKFDLSGIDPDKNPGVYSFKKGTGSFQVDFQGEWEIASPKWLLPIASRLVSQRIS